MAHLCEELSARSAAVERLEASKMELVEAHRMRMKEVLHDNHEVGLFTVATG